MSRSGRVADSSAMAAQIGWATSTRIDAETDATKGQTPAQPDDIPGPDTLVTYQDNDGIDDKQAEARLHLQPVASPSGAAIDEFDARLMARFPSARPAALAMPMQTLRPYPAIPPAQISSVWTAQQQAPMTPIVPKKRAILPRPPSILNGAYDAVDAPSHIGAHDPSHVTETQSNPGAIFDSPFQTHRSELGRRPSHGAPEHSLLHAQAMAIGAEVAHAARVDADAVIVSMHDTLPAVDAQSDPISPSRQAMALYDEVESPSPLPVELLNPNNTESDAAVLSPATDDDRSPRTDASIPSPSANRNNSAADEDTNTTALVDALRDVHRQPSDTSITDVVGADHPPRHSDSSSDSHPTVLASAHSEAEDEVASLESLYSRRALTVSLNSPMSSTGRTGRSSMGKKGSSSLRNVHPLPPLVPLLPHERSSGALATPSGPTAPTVFICAPPAAALGRSDSFESSVASRRVGGSGGAPLGAKPPGVSFTRQSTMHVPSTPLPRLPATTSATSIETTVDRQPSFDLTFPNSDPLGLLSLDRTEMKRSLGTTGLSTSWWSTVITPDSSFLAYWRLVILLCTIYNAIVIPFRIAFDGMPYSKPGAQEVSFFLDYLGDFLFILDIFLSFSTGFVEHGVIILSHGSIRRKYMKSWFTIDVLASIPLDLIQLDSLIGLNPFVRVNRLLRLGHVLDLSSALESAPTFSINARLTKLIRIPIYIFYASHLIACCWFGVARIEGFGINEWTVPLSLGTEGSQTFQYLRSLFWALGLMTGRDYENSTPETDLEALTTFLALTVGMIGLAYVIGNVAAVVEGANERSKHFQMKVAFVERFINAYDIPQGLKQQVSAFFEYIWDKTKGSDLPSVLSELPDNLTTDISMFLLHDIVSRVELFSGLDPGFVPALIKKMIPVVYLPGEFIVTYGDHGDSMYFLQQGEVDIIKGGSSESQGEVILSTLHTGDRFGEYSLILPTQRTASARAVGFATVYVLYREPFEELMTIFKKSAGVIKERAKKHHDATLAREAKVQAQRLGTTLDSTNNPTSSFPTLKPDTTDSSYEVETLRTILRVKDNSKEYRKKISVYAFQVDSSVTVYKSWGISACEKNDWIVIGNECDAYTVSNAVFTDSYEIIPNGPKHMYRKKGTVLAALVARPFRIITGKNKESLTAKTNDYLLQDEKLNQWFVPRSTFEDTYEVCVEKIVAKNVKKQNVLDANSAVIKALKGRLESSTSFSSIDSTVILPSSLFWKIWQPITLGIMMYNTFYVPFRIAFDMHSLSYAYLLFDYVGDIILWIDMFLHFRVAFVKDGQLVTSLSLIRSHYFSLGFSGGGFLYDFISLFPLDFFMIYTGMQPLFRLARILKIRTCYQISSHYIRGNSSWNGLLKLARMLFIFALFSHFESCIYWSFTYFEGYGTHLRKWLPNGEHYNQGHSTLANKYFRAQYYSFVVLTGLGKMNVPETNAETVFGLLSILLGVLVVSFIIGEIALIVSNLDSFAVENDKRSIAMSEFLREKKIPPELQNRVRRYMDHQWSVQKGADPNKALNGLPPMLRLQMKMQIAGDAIRRTPFFHQAADATLLAVVSAITFETYPPGEHIFVAGQVGDKMYIINRGLVEIQLPADLSLCAPAITIKTIGKGSWFGESIGRNGRRSASAICQKSCDLMAIHRKDFARIVADDPDFEAQLNQIAKTRLAVITAHQKRRKAQAKKMRAADALPPAMPKMYKRSSMFMQSSSANTAGPKRTVTDIANSSIQVSTGDSASSNLAARLDMGSGSAVELTSSLVLEPSSARALHSRKKSIAIRVSAESSAPQTRLEQGALPTAPPRGPLQRSFSFATTVRDHRENFVKREMRIGETPKEDESEEDEEDNNLEALQSRSKKGKAKIKPRANSGSGS